MVGGIIPHSDVFALGMPRELYARRQSFRTVFVDNSFIQCKHRLHMRLHVSCAFSVPPSNTDNRKHCNSAIFCLFENQNRKHINSLFNANITTAAAAATATKPPSKKVSSKRS